MKMELNRAVYPNQHVVGWYRVGDDNENDAGSSSVMEHDVLLHKQITDFCKEDAVASGRSFVQEPIFVFMKQSLDETGTCSNVSNEMMGVENLNEEAYSNNSDSGDDELPLSIYELQQDLDGSVAFVDVKFELNSRDTERIAMEHLFKAQETKDTTGHLEQIETSIEQLDSSCISILLQYLKAVRGNEIAPNFDILRRINSLLHQISATNQCLDDVVLKRMSDRYMDCVMLGNLASLAKTVQSIQGYTEKLSIVSSLEIGSDSGSSAGQSFKNTRERELFLMRSHGSGWL